MTHSFSIPATHPALPGHFPGQPLVPGVMILQQVIDAASREGHAVSGVAQAKFSAPLLPEQSAIISLESKGTRLHFTVQHEDVTLAQGALSLEPAGA